MAQVARATYQLQVQWDAVPGGTFTLDTSTIDGTDTIAPGEFLEAFTGTYDDVSDRFHGARITGGRDDLLQTMLAREATIDVRDPTGRFNPDNAGELVNHVPNPSIESAATGYVNEDNVTVARTTGEAMFGSGSLQVTATTAVPGRSPIIGIRDMSGNRIAATASVPWTFSAYVKMRSNYGVRLARLRWIAYDAGGSQVGGGDVQSGTTALTTSYQRITLTATPPATTTTLRLLAYCDTSASVAGEIFDWDGFQLEQASAATTYTDGSLDDCRWASTEHASTSYRGGPLYGILGDRLHPVRLTATLDSTDYDVYRGYVREITWEPNGRRATARLHCVDLFYWLARVYPTIAATGPTTTGAAIGLILDACRQLDPAARDLDTGDTIPDFSADGTKTALALIGELLAAERGVFHASRAGRATYRDRLSRLSTAIATTITDIMTRLVAGSDQDVIRNRVTIERTQNSYVATAELASSIARIGPSDLPTIRTPYLSTDEQADGLADWILPLVCEPRSQLRELTVDGRTEALLEQILTRDIGDRITVDEARGGTSADVILERVVETVAPTGMHQAVWLGSRASAIAPFLLDESLLDSGDVIVYGS